MKLCTQMCNSKCYYKLILLNSNLEQTPYCCLFWENEFEVDIDWPKVFKRYFIYTTENKLRQFNFKLLYNLLPVRKNLLKWGIVNDGICSHCNVEEDVKHAFISCKLNTLFFTYVRRIIQRAFGKHIEIDATFLIKSEFDDFDFVIILAFWCIYKLLLERNRTGIDRRNVGLKFLFAREIEKRIEINEALRKQHDNLPKKLLYCI